MKRSLKKSMRRIRFYQIPQSVSSMINLDLLLLKMADSAMQEPVRVSVVFLVLAGELALKISEIFLEICLEVVGVNVHDEVETSKWTQNFPSRILCLGLRKPSKLQSRQFVNDVLERGEN